MLCLGIETSCDETAVALLRDGGLVAEKLSSQESKHALFGGVVPELASREHLRTLWPLFDQLMAESGAEPGQLDAIAVARGPGLLGSLLVGLGAAKGLALSTGAALIGVDHLIAHLLAPGLDEELPFPAVGLLVSGGHTQIYLLRSALDFQLLGTTLDDAAGEAFDKAAKMLNLPYPGGKYIDLLAGMGEPDPDLLPRPYLDNRNLDFSFSGLKTAVANHVHTHPELRIGSMPATPDPEAIARSHPELPGFCASLNASIAETLQAKLRRALHRHPEARGVIAAGGVAANSMVRKAVGELASAFELPIVVPRIGLCTDNAAMIGFAGSLLYEQDLCHDLHLDAVPRGRPVPWDYQRFS
jgi:N6-L-threonylcarbamoyladenine synthase